VKNYYYDHFSKVHSPGADGKKKGGGRGGRGGNLNRSTTTIMTKPQSSKAKNKLIEADRNRSKCTRKGSKQSLCRRRETIEAKLKALPVLLAIAVNQIITIPDFIPHKCN